MTRILVVEDSPTILYILSNMLKNNGYEVIQATDGHAALEVVEREKPDMVLLDVILPALNGYHVCRHIKTTTSTAHIPVVIITSKSKSADRYWGIEQGADDYIVKPVDQEQLLGVLARLAPLPE